MRSHSSSSLHAQPSPEHRHEPAAVARPGPGHLDSDPSHPRGLSSGLGLTSCLSANSLLWSFLVWGTGKAHTQEPGARGLESSLPLFFAHSLNTRAWSWAWRRRARGFPPLQPVIHPPGLLIYPQRPLGLLCLLIPHPRPWCPLSQSFPVTFSCQPPVLLSAGPAPRPL